MKNLRLAVCCGMLMGLQHALYGQSLNGEMGVEGPSETVSTKVNPEAEKSLLLIRSQIPNLRFDSNRRIDKIKSISSGNWEVWLPAGTHILKIDADGYERLEMQPFSFSRKKIYDIKIFERKAPRRGNLGTGKGSLDLSTIPEGAKVRIEGIPGTWTTPVIIPEILSNIWKVSFAVAEYETLRVNIDVYPDSLVQPPPFRLIPTFGYIRLDSLFLNSTVTFNETKLSLSKVVKVPVGEYRLRVADPIFGVASKNLNVSPGDTLQIPFASTFEVGLVTFDAAFSTSKIILDNKTAFFNRQYLVPVGEHFLSAEHPHFGTKTKTFTVINGDTIRLQFKEIFQYGIIRIDSLFDQCQVTLDAKKITSSMNASLLIGEHLLVVEHPILGRRQQQISLRSDEIRFVGFNELFESGSLTITTDVNAQILVNGKNVGTRSVTLNANPGEYTIRIEHANLGTYKEYLTLQPRRDSKLSVSLLPSQTTAYLCGLLPGASQLYKNQTFRGYSYLTTFLLSSAGAAYTFLERQNEQNLYNTAIEKYAKAVTGTEAYQYRSDALSHAEKINQAQKYLSITAIVAASVYVLSMLDALFIAPRFGYRSPTFEEQRIVVGPSFPQGGAAVVVSLPLFPPMRNMSY